MQQVLATGAIGLIGSRFAEMFDSRYSVQNIDILSGVDITDKDSVRKFVLEHPGADTLIHLAAFTDTKRSELEKGNEDGLCYRVNVLGTKNIADVCKDFNLHLIHISTDFVFDGQKSTAYTEDDQPSPLDWYGHTKAKAEEVVVEAGISATIFRISYPYRAHFELKPDLIKKIRQGLESGTLPPQFSDTVITPTFIDDIARAFDYAIKHKPQGLYHIVGSSSLSPYELAQKVATSYDFDPSSVTEGSLSDYLQDSPRPYARTVAMSNHKAVTELGLHFATIDEGISQLKAQQA